MFFIMKLNAEKCVAASSTFLAIVTSSNNILPIKFKDFHITCNLKAKTSPKCIDKISLMILNRCHTGKDFPIPKRNDFANESL